MQSYNFVEPNILLWHSDLLWARYLEILALWRADADKEKINLPIYESPGQLLVTLRSILADALAGNDDEGLKLRWEILMAFGYGASKEWLKCAHAETGRITNQLAESLEEGFNFQGSIPPD